MGTEKQGAPARDGTGLDRRRFIRRAAAGGAAAWAAPAVITMRPSAAPLTSPPPGKPSDPADPADPADPGAQVQGDAVSHDPATEVQGQQVTRGQLARTGLDVDDMVLTGLAAIAGGGALALWSAEQTRSAPADDEPAS